MRFRLVEKIQDEQSPSENHTVNNTDEKPNKVETEQSKKVEKPIGANVNKRTPEQEIIDIKKNTKATFIE